jgi:hypothetical protein
MNGRLQPGDRRMVWVLIVAGAAWLVYRQARTVLPFLALFAVTVWLMDRGKEDV